MVAQVLIYYGCEVEIIDLQNANELTVLDRSLDSINLKADYYGISNNFFRTFASSTQHLQIIKRLAVVGSSGGEQRNEIRRTNVMLSWLRLSFSE